MNSTWLILNDIILIGVILGLMYLHHLFQKMQSQCREELESAIGNLKVTGEMVRRLDSYIKELEKKIDTYGQETIRLKKDIESSKVKKQSE